VPCMRSCLGVKVPRPGVRGAEGPGKRKGVTVRWSLKDAWNESAGRGTRTGYEVWYARDEWARDQQVLHPQLGRTLYIRRLCTEGMTADRGGSAGCPGIGLRAEESSLTAPQKSADGIVPPAKVGRPERWRGVVACRGAARWHPARGRARLGLWDELAAGTPGDDAPVGVMVTLTESTEPPYT
jgi:hypothetical protein